VNDAARSSGKAAALHTGNEKNIERFYQLQIWFPTEEAGFPGCLPCGWVIAFQRFKRKYCIHLQGYEELFFNVEDYGGTFLRKVENSLPIHMV